jgi:hypothetical protein
MRQAEPTTLPRRLHPIALCVLHAIHKHGAMHGKKKTVQRQQRLQSLQKVCLDCVVGSLFDWTPGYSLRLPRSA